MTLSPDILHWCPDTPEALSPDILHWCPDEPETRKAVEGFLPFLTGLEEIDRSGLKSPAAHYAPGVTKIADALHDAVILLRANDDAARLLRGRYALADLAGVERLLSAAQDLQRELAQESTKGALQAPRWLARFVADLMRGRGLPATLTDEHLAVKLAHAIGTAAGMRSPSGKELDRRTFRGYLAKVWREA